MGGRWATADRRLQHRDRRRRLRPLNRSITEEGSAVVDFALVGALLTVLFVAVLQLVVVLHVRNTLVDCAARGAGYGALSGADPADAADRTRELIAADLGARYTGAVSARVVKVGDLDTVEVRVAAPLPVAGLLGPGRGLTVTGHALRQPEP